jgi:RNA polymerase sigma factor (sigma-70 family)
MHLDRDELQQRQEISAWQAERTWDGIHDLNRRKAFRRRMEFIQYCREELRRARRFNRIEDEDGNNGIEEAIEASVEPVDVVTKRLVELALSILRPRDREMLELFYFEGLSQAEVAERYKLSEGRVSQIFKHAYGRMKGYLCRNSFLQRSSEQSA